jgi:hypothetical protein
LVKDWAPVDESASGLQQALLSVYLPSCLREKSLRAIDRILELEKTFEFGREGICIKFAKILPVISTIGRVIQSGMTHTKMPPVFPGRFMGDGRD